MLGAFLGRDSVKISNMLDHLMTYRTGMIQEPLRIFRMQKLGSGLIIMANLLISLCQTLICILIRSTTIAKSTLNW
ncbi:hypothetical protein PR202_ga24835 [Eleusine coracana subsp. coracana]|uniref:Uncharacterized protein n=1 Tax=Eleusine coracana subsp. coracana TaxID=191504 RepID=A0AAV5D9M9_ELECO|nr:hypothetical protein PR202_ga24835 [Eleusine coracana subsp. coracana]